MKRFSHHRVSADPMLESEKELRQCIPEYEKMTVTVITGRSTLSFDWAGKRRELVEDRTISTDAKLITIRHIWTTNVVEQSQSVRVGDGLTLTNATVMTNWYGVKTNGLLPAPYLKIQGVTTNINRAQLD